MPTTDCMVNRVLDALVSLFEGIGKDGDASEWYTAPKTVERYVPESDGAFARPAIFCEIADVGPFGPQTNRQGTCEATVTVYCLPDIEGDAESMSRQMHQMVADVLRATRNDFQLESGNEEDPVLKTGHIFDEGYRAEMVAGAGAQSQAQATLTLKCVWHESTGE